MPHQLGGFDVCGHGSRTDRPDVEPGRSDLVAQDRMACRPVADDVDPHPAGRYYRDVPVDQLDRLLGLRRCPQSGQVGVVWEAEQLRGPAPAQPDGEVLGWNVLFRVPLGRVGNSGLPPWAVAEPLDADLPDRGFRAGVVGTVRGPYLVPIKEHGQFPQPGVLGYLHPGFQRDRPLETPSPRFHRQLLASESVSVPLSECRVCLAYPASVYPASECLESGCPVSECLESAYPAWVCPVSECLESAYPASGCLESGCPAWAYPVVGVSAGLGCLAWEYRASACPAPAWELGRQV